MKQNQNIEELLNGFLDNQLTQRQQTELKRLIKNDSKIAQQMAELQKCKSLLGALPAEQAPAELLGDIKATLERSSLLPQNATTADFDHRLGVRHLLFRKALAAAAMIALFAGLGAVIYSIVGPKNITKENIFSTNWLKPTTKIEPAKETPTLTTEGISQKPLLAAAFNGTLELKTAQPGAIETIINTAIENNPLLTNIKPPRHSRNATTFYLAADTESINLLLADMETLWKQIDSKILFVQTDKGRIAIEKITIPQIAQITAQTQNSIELAKTFAEQNKITGTFEKEFASGEGKTNAVNVPTTIPKPLLTSAQQRVKKLSDKTEKNITLTIVITSE